MTDNNTTDTTDGIEIDGPDETTISANELEERLADTGPPPEADVTLTAPELNLLAETLPELIVKEKRQEARQMMFKTGRGATLEAVLEKVEEAEPTEPDS